MYKVIDCYDGEDEVLGTVTTFFEAIKLRDKRIDDTDGECNVVIINENANSFLQRTEWSCLMNYLLNYINTVITIL